MAKPVKKRSAVMKRIAEALMDHFGVGTPVGSSVFTLDFQKSDEITVEDFCEFSQEDIDEVLEVIKDALNGRSL